MRRGIRSLLLLLSAAACGTPATDGPKWSDVREVGHTLPMTYKGCDNSDTDPSSVRVTTCGEESDGRFVEFGEFNAVAGHSVHQDNANARLRELLRDCS